jgi:N-acetylneuraminic acid mutarotase
MHGAMMRDRSDREFRPLPSDSCRNQPTRLACALWIGALATALAACGGHSTQAQPDAGPPDGSCPQICELGAQRCNDNSVEICSPGADLCPAWGSPIACPADKPICGGGTCGRGCQDDCVLGATMCDGTSAMKTCGVTGGDVCLHWGPSTACAGSDLCAQGSCMASVPFNVTIDGAGTGTIVSDPAGIDCGLRCSTYFPFGVPVTLTATASGDSTFLGWSGGGCSTGLCTSTPPDQGVSIPPPPIRAIFGAPWEWRGFTGQARAPRDNATATWTGDQLIVWGGNTSGAVFNNDGERYTPATGAWSDINAVGAPPERYSHSAVWTGSELIIWGGRTDELIPVGLSNAGARWNPATGVWTRLPTAGAPAPRRDHVAFWTGTEMIIWGGYGDTGFPLTTGARFNPATGTWTALPTEGAPSFREFASVTWTGTNLVVWGGTFGITALADGARWNAASNTWVPMPTAGAPTPRLKHSATWTGSELIVWGGTTGNVDIPGGARWNEASDTWTALATTNEPSPRHGHSATWTGSQLVIWGGTSGSSTTMQDGARVAPDGDTWTALPTAGAPTARSGHVAVWTGDQILIWGGAAANDPTATSIARLSPTTWTWQGTALSPSPRWALAGVWTGSDLLVWGGSSGGFSGSGFPTLGDGGRFNEATNTWSPTAATGAPSPRGLHSAVWTGTEMIVWGGFDNDLAALATGSRYNPATGTWTALPTADAPTARGAHSAVWTGTEMIVWGGFDNDLNRVGDGARWNLATNTWSPLDVTGAPTARGAHSAVWTGTEMVIWGGMDSIFADGFHADGGRFNPATNTWTDLPSTGAPSPRGAHSAVWTGTEMIIWGGASGADMGSGSRWNPTTGAWHPVSDFNSPSARRFHVAAWTGTDMTMWGGISGGATLATGGVLVPSL